MISKLWTFNFIVDRVRLRTDVWSPMPQKVPILGLRRELAATYRISIDNLNLFRVILYVNHKYFDIHVVYF